MLFRLPIVKFFNRILNRITVTVVLVALQLAWLAWVFFALTTGTARVWVTGVLNGLSLLIILYLVRKDENSAYKVGWIALIGLLPLLGGALYLAFGNKRPSRRLRSKMQAVEQAHRADRAQQPGQTAGLCDENRGVSRYLTQYGCYPAWKNTTARYFSCGEAMYPALLADLEKAEKSIFLEFFIISQGKMWQGVEDILRRKAAQGVDVRLIYDDFGSLLGLPKDFVVRMERAHIRCIPFNPVVPLLSLVMNHRDHRKIVVIDGKVAYTGGINLADEYINAITRFGYWKDAGLRIEGTAVWNFTVMFLDFWNAFRPFEQDYSAFRPQLAVLPASDGVVQPYADSPLDEEPVAETVYLDILALGRNPEQQSEYVRRCLQKTEDIQQLTDRMFEYSLVYEPPQSPLLVPIPLKNVQHMLSEHLDFLRLAGFQTSETIAPLYGQIEGDETSLKRLFQNLFSNVLKYGDKSEPVTLQISQKNDIFQIILSNAVKKDLTGIESNRIGLKSAEKIAKMHHGTLTFTQKDKTLFLVEVTFPLP